MITTGWPLTFKYISIWTVTEMKINMADLLFLCLIWVLHGEITSCPNFKPTIPGLQIRRTTYWDRQTYHTNKILIWNNCTIISKIHLFSFNNVLFSQSISSAEVILLFVYIYFNTIDYEQPNKGKITFIDVFWNP